MHRTTPDIVEHFKYGSIGSEENGLPYRVWQALPRLFPEEFQDRNDYPGLRLPLRELRPAAGSATCRSGSAGVEWTAIELAWFNCAVCHTGTVAPAGGRSRRHLVPAMPSNNLDLYRFFRFLLDAGADERLSPDRLIPAMREAGAEVGRLEEKLWRFYIIPRLREGLVMRRSRLMPLLAEQPAWGPGRVDTFNPYKLLFKGDHLSGRCEPAERSARPTSRPCSMQGPTRGHAAALGRQQPVARGAQPVGGAGRRCHARDRRSRLDRRVSRWLLDLSAPPSLYRPDPAAVCAARPSTCASLRRLPRATRKATRYVFKGEYLGKVEPNARLGVDPHRLDSYTAEFQRHQLSELFKGTPYQFRHFRKTDGYANLPLDGLWLRAPYLHNGAVPTLADLLAPAETAHDIRARPRHARPGARWICRPALRPGPAAGAAHLLRHPPARQRQWRPPLRHGPARPSEKSDLLAYLLTF